MNIFIDTAVKGCNIALFDDDDILYAVQEPIERGHAETILPLVQQSLKNTAKRQSDIDAIYVTVGPGSFTGLRVGLTVAEFMGFVLQKPVYGLTTFQAFSCGVPSDLDRLIIIETKRSDYYCQHMRGDHSAINTPVSLAGDAIIITDQMIITGDATKRLCEERQLVADNRIIQQDMIDIPAVIKAIQAKSLAFTDGQPFYIRDADVSQPKHKKRVET